MPKASPAKCIPESAVTIDLLQAGIPEKPQSEPTEETLYLIRAKIGNGTWKDWRRFKTLKSAEKGLGALMALYPKGARFELLEVRETAIKWGKV